MPISKFPTSNSSKFVWTVFVILVQLSTTTESTTVTPSSEKRLIKQLINNYEKTGKIGRPVKNTKETIEVGLGLSLFQILQLDEKNQILTINVWTKYTWVDQLLRWDPANYSNVREVRIPPKLIWTPDIVLYNYVDERLKEQRDVMLNVDYMGRVFWSPPAIFKSRCAIDIRNFPFDYQFCFLQFGSATQHNLQMDLQFLNNRTEVDTVDYTKSTEWKIVAKPARRYLISKCDKKVPVLTFFLFLKRNPAYYAYILVFPSTLLSLITAVIFWLPPHIPAKMLLSVNIFLAFFFILKILASSTPSASTAIPFLGYFFSMNLVLLSLSTFISAWVINIHTYSHKIGSVPPWVIKIVKFFSTVLSVSRPEDDEKQPEKLSSIQAKLERAQRLNELARPFIPSYGNFPMQPIKALNAADRPSGYPYLNEIIHRQGFQPMMENCWNNNNTMKHLDAYLRDEAMNAHRARWSQHSTPDRLLQGLPGVVPQNYCDEHSNDSALSHDGQQLDPSILTSKRATMQIHTCLSNLRIAFKNLMEKIAKKDALAKRAREWRLVVMTIDRLFFWFYLIVLITGGCYLLIPRGQAYTVEEIIQSHTNENHKKNIQEATECLLGIT